MNEGQTGINIKHTFVVAMALVIGGVFFIK